jgi:hypothetical protein
MAIGCIGAAERRQTGLVSGLKRRRRRANVMYFTVFDVLATIGTLFAILERT